MYPSNRQQEQPRCVGNTAFHCQCGVQTGYKWCGAGGLGCFCKVDYVKECDSCRLRKMAVDAERAGLKRIKRAVQEGGTRV